MANKQEETYVYVTAANGMQARVPMSRLAEWQKGQEEIRQGKLSPEHEAEIQRMKEGLRKKLLGK